MVELPREKPERALELFADMPGLRLLIIGGDGTVGWVLSCLDALQVAVDWSLHSTWNGKLRDHTLRLCGWRRFVRPFTVQACFQLGLKARLTASSTALQEARDRQEDAKPWLPPPIAVLPLGTGAPFAPYSCDAYISCTPHFEHSSRLYHTSFSPGLAACACHGGQVPACVRLACLWHMCCVQPLPWPHFPARQRPGALPELGRRAGRVPGAGRRRPAGPAGAVRRDAAGPLERALHAAGARGQVAQLRVACSCGCFYFSYSKLLQLIHFTCAAPDVPEEHSAAFV